VATLAAASWASEESNSSAASGSDHSSGGHGCASSGSDVRQDPRQQERQQMHLYMQQAAFHLGKAVELLLPADATDSLDALEQHPVLSLLTALAAVRCVHPDALQRYLRVRPGLVVDMPHMAHAAVLDRQHLSCTCIPNAWRSVCSCPALTERTLIILL
jgi:hypothetical protein